MKYIYSIVLIFVCTFCKKTNNSIYRINKTSIIGKWKFISQSGSDGSTPYTFSSDPENSQTIILTKKGNILIEKLNMKGFFSCDGSWKLIRGDYISLNSTCNQFNGSYKIFYSLKADTLAFAPLCREGCSYVYKAIK